MRIPEKLEVEIEKEVSKYNLKELKEVSLNLSKRYMESKRTGETLFKNNLDFIAYSVIRMPATYSAIKTCIEKVKEVYDVEIHSVVDVGSGTGAAEWALLEIFDDLNITCIEREKNMREIAKLYLNDYINKIEFIDCDILKNDLNFNKDLSIMSYIINELPENKRLEAFKNVFETTEKMILIVEPGTPEGFNNIKQIRDYAFKEGYSIVAPCTGFCGRCDIKEDDWCASSVRVQRSKIHKYLKDAEIGFEDEKFSYIVISKEKHKLEAKRRILRHPKIQSGFIEVKVCISGEIKEEKITKKNKEEFKILKKKNIGDIF